jgi:hypothetical protein
MVLVLDKKSKIKKTKSKIEAIQSKKGFDAFQFLGKIKKWDNLTPEVYQKNKK